MSEPDSRSSSQLRVETFVLGPYATNCYLLIGERSCVLIDCGFDPGEMLDEAEAAGVPVEAVVLTHAHVDHIAGLYEARKRFPDVPIWIHSAERDWLTDAMKNLSGMTPTPVTAPPADRLLEDGETLTLAGTAFEVRHTPGHSPGSISLVNEALGVAFVGDALFHGSIGRTDFPGSKFETLERSIREKLYTLDPDTRVYSGHGPTTTVGREMKSNPFVRPA